MEGVHLDPGRDMDRLRPAPPYLLLNYTSTRGMLRGTFILILGASLLGCQALPTHDRLDQAPFDVDVKIEQHSLKTPRPLVIWYDNPPTLENIVILMECM